MPTHLQREIENVKKRVLHLSALVEDRVQRALEAVLRRDEGVARKIIDSDIEIDTLEVEIEEECLKVLALHQPVAVDLRFLIGAIKLNHDLERLGDQAVSIAKQATHLAGGEKADIPADLPELGRKSVAMLKKSLDAFVNMDQKLARQVCADDDEVDALNRKISSEVQANMRQNPERIGQLLRVLSTSRHLERVADHATNIAEDVVYMTQGEIVRHKV